MSITVNEDKMVIGGLNKTTLLDFPGAVACTVFIYGCNFRCPFCHNPSLVNGESSPIEEGEFFSFLEKRKGVLEGVCVTGGEPTLNKELPDFLKKIKALGYRVKLDTNGSNPQMLKGLIGEGIIDYVAMDIKNSLDKYGITVGIDGYDTKSVEKSVEIIMTSLVDYEFRTTVVKELHNEDSFLNIAKWLKGAKAYFLQQFDNGKDLLGTGLTPYSDKALYAFCEAVKPFFGVCGVRGV